MIIEEEDLNMRRNSERRIEAEMIKYMTKAEYERMNEAVIDEDTGMTEMDYYEWLHPYDDLVLIDDEAENEEAENNEH